MPISLHTWSKGPRNIINHDFELFDGHADLMASKNRWTFCNYNDGDVGFPRDCGKKGPVANTWFSMPGGRFNARGLSYGSRLEIHGPDHCPAPNHGLESGRNLIRNGTFNAGTRHWTEFNQAPRRNGFHVHTWAPGHVTGHLHGYCPTTAGGMAQTFPTQAGQTYRLAFDAYSGQWDGADVDTVVVSVGDQTRVFNVPAKHAVNAGLKATPLPVEFEFTAMGPSTHLSFYSEVASCIDVDNVVVSVL